jgi:hypothetical protein
MFGACAHTRGRVLILAALVLTGACGGSSPTAPTSPQIAGNWSGTFESDNWPVRSFVMTLSQANSRIDGAWASDPWTETLSGSVDTRTFSGQMTMNAPGTTATCVGTASLAGAVGSGSVATLRWTSVGVSGNCTGMPINIVINVQRR